MARDPATLVLLREQLRHAPVELGRRLAVGIGFQDARLGFHHLAERPIAHPVAVGQAPALPPGDQVRHPLDVDEELVHETALADPGFADERDELRLALMSCAIERVAEDRELAIATDERGVDATGDVDPVVGPGLDRLPDHDRVGFPLRFDGIPHAVLDRPLGGAIRRVADQHPIDGGGCLEPGRRVHHVAGGHPFALERANAERDERLAGVHADPDVEIDARVLLVHLRQRVADRQRGPDCPFGVVLVRGRGAEHRHHRVPDELLHRAASALQLLPEPREVRE